MQGLPKFCAMDQILTGRDRRGAVLFYQNRGDSTFFGLWLVDPSGGTYAGLIPR